MRSWPGQTGGGVTVTIILGGAQQWGNPILAEVVGFEPTAPTLRKCGSRCFDQVLSYDLPGSGVAIPSGSLLATITFLGERADITGPDAAVPASGQTRNANVLSA